MEWFTGDRFWLNKVDFVSLESEDPRLTAEERQQLQEAHRGLTPEQRPLLEIPISDPRSGLDTAVNLQALSLRDLRLPDVTAALLTTFDLPDDVHWLKEELGLSSGCHVTIAAHPWDRFPEQLWNDLQEVFQSVILHFPGSAHLSRSSDGGVHSLDDVHAPNPTQCSVHAKVILLDSSDRLRVVITSANLLRRFWRENNEALWVKDFQRREIPELSSLLVPGFGQTLAHFLANSLEGVGGIGGIRGSWLRRLASFDLDAPNVKLVASLPGLHPPRRALQRGELALRLSLEKFELEEFQVPLARVVQLQGAELRLGRGRWTLTEPKAEAAEAEAIAYLDAKSCRALEQAQRLGLEVLGGWQVLPVDVLPTWDETEMPLIRVTLAASAAFQRAVPEIEDLLSVLEINYGLFAIQEHLAHEDWPQAEEEHYMAITCAVSAMDDCWFRSFDQCCGRAVADAGPKVVVPNQRPISASYQMADWRNRLVEHRPPAHSPGREQLLNHSKLIARLFTHEGKSYGWAYVGSHNLTVSAWGTLHRLDESNTELHWSGNRELGVLLVRPRGTFFDLNQSAPSVPLPFQLSPRPAALETWQYWMPEWRLEKCKFQEEEEFYEENQEEWAENGYSDNWNWEWQHWEDSEDFDEHPDWRLRRASWWWWVS